MIGAVKRAWANFRGFDLTGSTVPPMDGPLRPNAKLDAAPLQLNLADIDNLVLRGRQIVCSVGHEIHTLAPAAGNSGQGLSVTGTRSTGKPVTSMAATGDLLAVAVEGEGIRMERPDGASTELIRPEGLNVGCITAMAFADPSTLLVAVGSARNPAYRWKHDLMTKTAEGSVWRVDLGAGTAVSIASGLAFPSGIIVSRDRVFVSEAWRHRVLSTGLDGSHQQIALGSLPAYPGRIAPAAEGGFWLAMFAPRNPLVEFVLKEDEYRRRMIETIDPEYWIAPSLVTGRSFLEPIQGGARKKLNMLKPWSPTWSAGLVVRCDESMAMLRNYQSRADGDVHGVTSMCEADGRLLVGAKGSGKIVAIDERAGQTAR
ncbi:strictosidine synthase [Mesorhizobium sanjuanii]|uniref:Strictosidine synthase n=1 Tax=Mesorhizobium sanjuanii TaxID=2037900 RepID=A0A2A6FMI6_9HYPH|nr:strictosidine synthase [Mesorhizobium sanjuanii]PDQ22962.1 strictosidine synthase [Mesorhizobium sanjuanii]